MCCFVKLLKALRQTRAFCHNLLSSLSALHRPAPKNEDEMMVAIFEYIDRLFNIVRPRRVLYMAIDGVVTACLNTCQRIQYLSVFWLV